MKHLLYSTMISLCFFFSRTHSHNPFQYIPVDNHESTLVVVLMVKDEAEVIIPTLQPFIDAGIDSYLIYDTGSSDGTPEKARTYFKECGIAHAYILEEPFVDFSTSRNRALDLADQIFCKAHFLIMIDAEWYIHNAQDLLQFCEHNKYSTPNSECYFMRLLTTKDVINNYTSRLIRSKSKARFVGVVHEVLNQSATQLVPTHIYFEYSPTQKGNDKSKKRWEHDCVLLHKHLEEHPNDSRTLFYLAQTYQFLNDWQNAIIYYKKRLELEGMQEERYHAAYRIGYAIEYLMYLNPSDISLYTWDDALHYYLKAHSMRPQRAEPLFRIALHYVANNEKEIAFLFAHRAAMLPYPQHDVLFVENRVYDYLRYDILGQCAFNVGEYEIGKTAVLKALKVTPHQTHLQHNLGLYLQHTSLPS